MYQTTIPYWHTYQWYVVHCKPRKEWQAARALEEHFGLKVYLPEVRRHLHGQVQSIPFFPRYLFAQVNLQTVPVSSINTIPGVLRLVAFGAMPQPIQPAAIELIRQRVDDLNSHGGLPEHCFTSGDTVRLKGGPFQGLEALFVGPMEPRERVWVLINFLGGLREAEVDVDILERATPAPAPRQARRTRGKGRRIRIMADNVS
jgi:transcriptional antiterminator RfaH